MADTEADIAEKEKDLAAITGVLTDTDRAYGRKSRALTYWKNIAAEKDNALVACHEAYDLAIQERDAFRQELFDLRNKAKSLLDAWDDIGVIGIDGKPRNPYEEIDKAIADLRVAVVKGT